MITFEHVSKVYPDGTHAVHDLTFDAPSGRLTVLVGPSGCGKTTSMRMINRLIDPTEGVVSLDGQDTRSVDAIELRRKIGYVIQSAGLFPHRTVVDNVAALPRLLGTGKKEARTRALALLAKVGLDERHASRYPYQLSGGQQQRVGVARALATDPPFLLMDEPFSAVDPVVRTQLQDSFLELQRDIGKTIVMVTHDIDEALKLGDQVAVFREGGTLAQVATPAELLAHPADEQVADFVGSGGLRTLTVTRLREEHLEPLDGVATGDLGAAIDIDSSLEEALATLLRDDKPMIGVRRGAQFVGVLTPAGVHRALRESLR
jgi:osmoprotectant transport system ATP-binding protein